MARPRCPRCHRPSAACYCATAPVPTPIRIVFLQHPRERRRAIGTARLAHLALPNSELHVGVTFDDNARVQALAADTSGRTAVLFPGSSGMPAVRLGEVDTLLVPDGTWSEARKLVGRNPFLARLPRIALDPSSPSRYRIRRAPAPHCLSTVEAVVALLAEREGTGERFAPVLHAFDRLVTTQLAGAARHAQPYRHTRRRIAARPVTPELVTRRAELLVVYGEANTHSRRARLDTPAELIHLVALRPHTGERFVAVIAPRRPLAPSAPAHLELPADRIVHGEPVATALARWRAFLRPDDLLCAWGHYVFGLLRAEGEPERAALNLRSTTNCRLGRKAGGIEHAAALLASTPPPPPWTEGRAGRRLAALAHVLAALVLGADPGTHERVA